MLWPARNGVHGISHSYRSENQGTFHPRTRRTTTESRRAGEAASRKNGARRREIFCGKWNVIQFGRICFLDSDNIRFSHFSFECLYSFSVMKVCAASVRGRHSLDIAFAFEICTRVFARQNARIIIFTPKNRQLDSFEAKNQHQQQHHQQKKQRNRSKKKNARNGARTTF